ncbi:MAG: thioredoxin fold domain-containing protein [Dehalococcoidales bacterium]|nr:thioredoxin fold domain-containing protein [Dehalococcoidales bacterium]
MKNVKLISGVLVIVLLGLTAVVPGCGPKTAATGDTVRVHYTVNKTNGEAVESTLDGEPFSFTLGQDQVIPGFEQAVLGMKTGEKKTVTIPSDQAYGEYQADLVFDVGNDELPEDLVPEVGMMLQASSNDGSIVSFTIIAVAETTVTLDSNHPLAGEDLVFEIELVEVSSSGKAGTTGVSSAALTEALSNGKPTLAEFGSETCAPCRQMKPILEALTEEYKDRANILIIDVYDDMALTRSYGIVGIPTQIFFDSNGEEITRHTGFMAKEDVIAQLEELGTD